MAIVSFRYSPAGFSPEQSDEINQRLIGEMIGDGFAVLTSTVLRGRTALRLCTTNPRTTDADLIQTIDKLENLAAKLSR